MFFLFSNILQRSKILSYEEVIHRYGGVTVSVPASTWVYHGTDPPSGQTKDYKIDISK